LENKLETLSNNFSNLFNLPNSGEAWLTTDDQTNLFKLQMIRTGVSPVSPIVDQSNTIYASLTDNNILRDMVSPKTFLKLNISNLPENVENVMMRKYIFYNVSVYQTLQSASELPDFDINVILYSYKKGTDYDYYDSTLTLPTKQDKYNSQFKIEDVVSTTIFNGTYTYVVEVDTLKYNNAEDPSIEYSLKLNDKVCLGDKSVVYIIKDINTSKNQITIEESVGHSAVLTYDEDNSMILGYYVNDFSDYHYVQVPLEENQYIAIMLATIQNNTRSILSDPLFFDLSKIEMTDTNGQILYDSNGNKMSYLDYYEKYCTNIGDLILGLTEAAYPQLSNLTAGQLDALQNDTVIQSNVSDTIDSSVILKVVPINSHIIDTTTTEELISLHSQKNELSSQISALNTSISDVNNTITTTDFSQDVSTSQSALQAQVTQYYSQRTLLQKQLISVVNNINTSASQLEGKEIKYHIRGITSTDTLESYIKSTYSDKIELIGIDVEYKYKALNKETTSVITINSNVFTDWNKLVTIDKERYVEQTSTGGYNLVFENYNSTNNIIKWNQIDIPITADEDVVIRVRYKYNIGQPFINIYSPWSDEITMTFPTEYKDNVEVNTIISENQTDVIDARFSSTLINDGYTDHISNKITSADATFYHSADNIYSGFNTSENSMLSLKDKLQQLSNTLAAYEDLLSSELNSKYKVYLVYDNKQIELLSNASNTIEIYNNDHITNSFVRKDMSIVIKNTGDTVLKLYSIFPGNINTPLLFNTDTFYEKTIGNYERVPIIANEVAEYQKLGQWVYFRQNNPWTSKDIYYNNELQNKYDYLATDTTKCTWNSALTSNLMKQNYNQVLFGWRKREGGGGDTFYLNTWKTMSFDSVTGTFTVNTKDSEESDNVDKKYTSLDNDFFKYENNLNDYLVRYEDIFYLDNNIRYYLDSETSLSEFVGQHDVSGNFSDDISFTGAFLYPNVTSMTSLLTSGDENDYISVSAGETINIPITLEFYLNEDLTSVTKGIYFDIKPTSNIVHYMIDITAVHDWTSSGNLMSNISLVDDTIE
jgi:hypothetical protein